MPGIAEQKAACCRRTTLLDGSAIAGRRLAIALL